MLLECVCNRFDAFTCGQNPPDFLLGVVRKDGSTWSLANAFEKPVKLDREGGYMEASVAALDSYWGKLTKVYGMEEIQPVALAVSDEVSLANLRTAVAENREQWIRKLLAQME